MTSTSHQIICMEIHFLMNYSKIILKQCISLKIKIVTFILRLQSDDEVVFHHLQITYMQARSVN
jgi:hypothetical protein